MVADAREAGAKPLRTGWSGQRDGDAKRRRLAQIRLKIRPDLRPPDVYNWAVGHLAAFVT